MPKADDFGFFRCPSRVISKPCLKVVELVHNGLKQAVGAFHVRLTLKQMEARGF